MAPKIALPILKNNFSFPYRQVHFTASFVKKIVAGIILGAFLDFIIIFLQPFDTSQFEAENRVLLLSGYGILTAVAFIIHSCLENIWYHRFGKRWLLVNEIISVILFCWFSGTALYLYNRFVINDLDFTFETYWSFFSITILYMIPVIIPPMLFLRQKFGELIRPISSSTILLTGANKNEILKLEKEELLFVKAVENYVEICFVDKNTKLISKTFRQTLSNVCEQLPFLKKCHRSYLVNAGNIKAVIGNSQGAKISFLHTDVEIPLSKTHYREIKNCL